MPKNVFQKRKGESDEELDVKLKEFDDRIAGLQKARQQKIEQAKKDRIKISVSTKKVSKDSPKHLFQEEAEKRLIGLDQ